ncbi:zinc metalloprotease ywhC [Candidatus Saccharibacteria bacterium]|nr:MAG: zinc metalloprotease ywhC [Candidatus Saccharibacteria bacterium]
MDIGVSLFNIGLIIGCILISLSLHEFMHAYVGFRLGDDTAHSQGRVSLNPLSHIDPFMTVLLPIITLITVGTPILAAKPVPFDPGRVKFQEFGAALIALAGPLTNLVLAILASLLVGFTVGLPRDVLQIFIGLNISIFVFNMVPIPPLDGSRVLYAFAPEPVQRFMAQMETYGLFIVFFLVLAVPGFSQILRGIMGSVADVLLRLS